MGGVGRQHLGRRRQQRLEQGDGGHVAGSDGLADAIAGEIGLVGPARAEALDRLHAVMGVERGHGEMAQRVPNRLLAEGLEDQVGIDTLQFLDVDEAVGIGGNGAEAHPLGRERDAHRLARTARFGHPLVFLALQIDGHLARQNFDQAGAEYGGGAALHAELGFDGVEVELVLLRRDEDIGDEIARPAGDRLGVASGAGIGVGTRGTEEHRHLARRALGRDGRGGRGRAALAVERGEARGEEQLAEVADLLERHLARFDIRLAQVIGHGVLVADWRRIGRICVIGQNRPRQKQQRDRASARQDSPPLHRTLPKRIQSARFSARIAFRPHPANMPMAELSSDQGNP